MLDEERRAALSRANRFRLLGVVVVLVAVVVGVAGYLIGSARDRHAWRSRRRALRASIMTGPDGHLTCCPDDSWLRI